MSDLSASFDTVSHEIPMDSCLIGSVQDDSDPPYHLVHNLFKLNVQDLVYVNLNAVCPGVRPWAFVNVFYTSPVADIIKRHNLMYHLSADDTQLYVSLKLGSDDHVTPSLIMDLHWLRVDHRIIYNIFFCYIRLSMDLIVISPICSVFAATLYVLVRISYFKSRDLS